MVTGKESVYKNDTLGNITLLNKKNVRDKYIFIEEFPTPNEALNEYMLENKNILINRKIKSYTEQNWWVWGAPRNMINIENSTKHLRNIIKSYSTRVNIKKNKYY